MKELLKKILALFPARRQPKNLERGVFVYDEKKGKVVKIRETPKDDRCMYAMPLEEYQNRKYHLTKGHWHRRHDKSQWDSNWDKIFRGGGINGSKLRQIRMWWEKIFGRKA